MSTALPRNEAVVAPPAPATRARALALSADAVAALCLTALCAALAVVTWRAWGNLGQDTGYDLLAGVRTMHGRIPYEDYVYYYGPVAPVLYALAFVATGANLGSAIALGIGLAVVIVGLTYAVARQVVGAAGAGAAAALTAVAAFGVDNNSYVLPHALSAPLGMALILLMVLLLARGIGTGGRRWTLAAGLALGLTALCRPDAFLAAGAAVTVWIVVRLVAQADARRAVLRDAAAIAAPALAIPALVYGAVLTQVSAHDLLHVDLFPSGGLSHVLKQSAPGTPSSFAQLLGRLAVYGVLTAALLGAGTLLSRADRARRRLPLVVGAMAAGALIAVVARPELVRHWLQFAYGWIPAGACAAVAWVAWRRRGRLDAATQVMLLVATALAVLAAKNYASFFPHPQRWSAQQAAYAMPLAAIFLAWLHLEALPHGRARREQIAVGLGWLAALGIASVMLVADDAGRESVTVSGEHGALRATPAQGPAYQAAVDAIQRDSGPGDPVLLAPQMTALYVMTGRAGALPQLSLLPGALGTSADERLAIARMHAVRVAVTDRRSYSVYGAGPFGSGDYDPLVGAWLRREFQPPVRVSGTGTQPTTLDLWRRSAP